MFTEIYLIKSYDIYIASMVSAIFVFLLLKFISLPHFSLYILYMHLFLVKLFNITFLLQFFSLKTENIYIGALLR